MTTLAQEVENPVIDVEDIVFKDVDDEKHVATQLPDTTGYKLLIALPEILERTEGGIIKSAQSQHEESISTVVGFVLGMGPDAYANFSRFPSGPYCQKGDWVVFRAFSGTRGWKEHNE